MAIELLKISNLRNIEAAELLPGKKLNFIHGRNASGKSSLLEALYLLGRGKSFRDTRVRPIIRESASALNVFARYRQDDATRNIGISKSLRGTIAKIDGIKIDRLSQLAREMPIQIITPNSHEILERGASYRRKFIDWSVFHVEHEYPVVVARYQRALAQRNAALKMRSGNAQVWNQELTTTGEQINRMRTAVFERLLSLFHQERSLLFSGLSVELRWESGWKGEGDDGLDRSLSDSWDLDNRRGFTTVGPHKADIHITNGEIPVTRRISRGQQKILIIALFLAQWRLITELSGYSPLLLMDDLASELDNENRTKVLDRIDALGCQAFITGTNRDLFGISGSARMFHVEHGLISEEGV